MTQKIKFVYLFAAVLLLSATGCKKYLDVNKNLNDPTKVPVAILFTGAELQMGQALAFLIMDCLMGFLYICINIVRERSLIIMI